MIETKEPIRDHFEGCFRHLNEWFNTKFRKKQHGRFKAMKPMIDFCGVQRLTVERWLAADLECALPKGEIFFKLICYFDLHGYKVIEFERMPKVLRNFTELIGYGVITAEQANIFLGYVDVSALYQVLNEKAGLSKEKETKMFDVWKERRGELERRKHVAFKSSRLEVLFKSTHATVHIEQQMLALASPAGSESSRRSAILHILQGLLGFLDEGLFDNLSEDELINLKQSSGQTILRLSAHLSILSSKITAAEKE